MEIGKKAAREVSKKPAHLIRVDEQQLHDHLGELVRGSVEQAITHAVCTPAPVR